MADSTQFRFSSPAPDRRDQTRTGFRKSRRPNERVRLMGQTVDLVKPEEVLHHMQQWILERRKAIIANHNLNSLYLLRKHPEMRSFYDRAELVELDSTPLVHFAKLLGINSRPFHRCTYLDWRDHFWSLVNRNGWRVMYVGATQQVIDIARERLTARYPRANIRAHHGYFDATSGSAESTAVLEQIADFQPHILFVGMGMPRQEIWITRNFHALPDCAIFSVGAAFDYEAGVQKSAPRWMGRAGVEWLYRLAADPRRLFRRYCVEPWSLLDLVYADLAISARRRLKARAKGAADTMGLPQSERR
jgi:N-acetylglucosaminyldiphosphoundecaprenol N-acetyl-beta-D-mannosaminyltransferase